MRYRLRQLQDPRGTASNPPSWKHLSGQFKKLMKIERQRQRNGVGGEFIGAQSLGGGGAVCVLMK